MSMYKFDATLRGAAYADQSLSQKHGPETVNYFAGTALNRVSFLRGNYAFLRVALPQARFLVFHDLAPLSDSSEQLALLTYDDVKSLIGSPYELSEDEYIAAYDSRVEVPTLIFLGINEKDTAECEFAYEGKYRGRPHFAVDVTPRGVLKEKCEELLKKWVTGEREFKRARLNLKYTPDDATMMGQARHIIHWNDNNKYCSVCGSTTLAVHAGTKRVCPSTDKALDPPDSRPPCPTRKGVHNVAFPRTDPTVIMAIVNSAGDKVLLGHNKRWPEYFYSTLAGFCEPSESVEDAVRRETWEEAGVKVGRVVIHSTQPWPYPACLMIGAIGQALPGAEELDLGHDPELAEAKWFPIPYIRECLAKDNPGLEEEPEGYKEGDLRLPPATAIAHQLLLAVTRNFHESPKI